MKKSLKYTILVIMAIGGGYFASPIIGHIKHKTKNQLLENFDETKNNINLENNNQTTIHNLLELGELKYGTEDFETNATLNIISGHASDQEILGLLKKYGYDSINVNNKFEKDTTLYKTVREIHQENANPIIRFRGNYKNLETGKHEHNRPRYNPFTHTIFLHNLDSIKLDFEKDIAKMISTKIYTSSDGEVYYKTANFYDDPQRYLLNNWIAELSHAYQNNKIGAIQFGVRTAVDYLRAGLEYNHTYDINGTIENDAHQQIEPLMIQQFINKYIQNTDLNQASNAFKIAIFYNGYFEKFVDKEKYQHWLEIAANLGSKEASFLMASITFKKHEDIRFASGRYNYYKTLRKNKENKQMMDSLLNETFKWLETGASHGDYNAISLLVNISKNYNVKIDTALTRQIHLLKNWNMMRKDPKFDLILSNEYMKLSDLFVRKNDTTYSKIYYQKAINAGFNFANYYPY